MNKKQAIAYAQVTLGHMQSSKYNAELNLQNLGIEMKQCFKLYPLNIILNIATSQLQAEKKIQDIKNGCDVCD